MTSSSKDNSVVELGAQGFMFAVTQIDPTVGRLSASFILRSRVKNMIEREIQLVPCEELLPGAKHAGKSNNALFDI